MWYEHHPYKMEIVGPTPTVTTFQVNEIMGYIYVITNLVNSKKYIGKTDYSIEERWQEHCKDCKREHFQKRPLYDAINKYGVENFKIEELEYIEDNSKLGEREIYWINEFQTYGRNGYNATLGGDGKTLYDHTEILELYRMGYSVPQVSQKIGCDPTVVSKVLRANGIKSRGTSKMVDQFDLAGNYIQTFDSTKDAKEWLFKNGITTNKTAHKVISDVCAGRRNNPMYKYIWKYKEVPELT